MNWTKLLYVLIIVLIYIPMAFLGVNVFYPKYTGPEDQFPIYDDCNAKYPFSEKCILTDEERESIWSKQQQCQDELRLKEQNRQQERLAYEGTKYVIITIFNLVILLLALFLPRIQDSVSMGLFLGSIAATFGATIRYFDSRSKIGFIILVITFFIMLYFINKKKESFVNWKEK